MLNMSDRRVLQGEDQTRNLWTGGLLTTNSPPSLPPPSPCPPSSRNEEELKAGQTSSLEEDEGFSDGGAQRRERARRRQAGLDSGEEETAWDSSQPRLRRQERQEEKEEATDERAGAGGVAGREQVERERAGSRDLREGARPAPSREVGPPRPPPRPPGSRGRALLGAQRLTLSPPGGTQEGGQAEPIQGLPPAGSGSQQHQWKHAPTGSDVIHEHENKKAHQV